MTIKELYESIGADYEDALHRLMNDRLVTKFSLKFLDDQSFASLCAAMEAEDWETAFRAAHTLKGVAQNLAFTELGKPSAALTEALRGYEKPEDPALLEQVKSDYERTAAGIRAFQAG